MAVTVAPPTVTRTNAVFGGTLKVFAVRKENVRVPTSAPGFEAAIPSGIGGAFGVAPET